MVGDEYIVDVDIPTSEGSAAAIGMLPQRRITLERGPGIILERFEAGNDPVASVMRATIWADWCFGRRFSRARMLSDLVVRRGPETFQVGGQFEVTWASESRVRDQEFHTPDRS